MKLPQALLSLLYRVWVQFQYLSFVLTLNCLVPVTRNCNCVRNINLSSRKNVLHLQFFQQISPPILRHVVGIRAEGFCVWSGAV